MTIADTDVLIDYLSGVNPSADRIAAELAHGSLATTAITRFELLCGARNPRQKELIRELLALIPTLSNPRGGGYYGRLSIAACAIVLASVLHMIVFLVVAATVVWFLFQQRISGMTRKRVGYVVIVLVFLGAIVLPDNLRTLPYQVSLFRSDDLPKAEMIHRAVFEMPREYPAMPLIGLGPGQFSSRAALISTGLYFGGFTNPRAVPFLKEQMSVPLTDDLLDLWLTASDETTYGGSSSAKPFFSWISVYTEFGGIVLIGIFVFSGMTLFRLRRKGQFPGNQLCAMATGIALVFLLLLGFQENYWEVPQAIFPGVLIIQVMYANVVHGSGRGDLSQRDLAVSIS